MSEKVLLTQDQYKMIGELMVNGSKETVLERHASRIYEKGYHVKALKVLNDIKVSDMARILYTGEYEIKPKELQFKAGDKIIRKDGLTFAGTEFIWTVVEDQQESWKVKVVGSAAEWDVIWETASIRHATPEEAFWLHELGRDKVPDFKVGDAVATYEDEDLDIVVSEDCYVSGKVGIRNAGDWFESGIIKGIYPAESFKPFRKDGAK